MFSFLKFKSKTCFLQKNLVSTISMSQTQFYVTRTYFSGGCENTIFLFDPFLIFMILSISKNSIFQTFSVENTSFRYFSNEICLKINQFFSQIFKNKFRYFSNASQFWTCSTEWQFFGFCGHFLDKFSFFKLNSKIWILQKNLDSTKSVSQIYFYLPGTYISRGRENTIFLFDPFLIFVIFSIFIFTIFQTISVENTSFRYFSNEKCSKIDNFLGQIFKNNFRYFSNVS